MSDLRISYERPTFSRFAPLLGIIIISASAVSLGGCLEDVPAVQELEDQELEYNAEQQTQSIVATGKRFRQAKSDKKDKLLEKMISLARARQQRLSQLIEDNPGAVLRLALPRRILARLPAAVRELMEQEIELKGEMVALIEHGDSEIRTKYFIRDNRRTLRPVYFEIPPTQVSPNRLVRIRGLQLGSTEGEDSDSAAVVAYSGDAGLQYLAPDGDEGQTAQGGTIGDVVNPLGEQSTVVILVNFQDTATEMPFTLADAHDAIFGTVNDFFFEASYTQTWFVGEVYGWYTLPIDSTCNTIDITNAADAAAAATGVDLSAYGRLIYVMQGSAQCFWSGASDMWTYPSRAWLNGNLDPMVIAHELGHGFGLNHSNLLDCGDTVLGTDCATVKDDKFDTMGASPEPGHFNAFQKERLGWFVPSAIVTVGTDSTQTLQPMELTGGTKAIKILKDQDPAGQGATWYYLEYRQALGFDSFVAGNDNVENGVLIHTGADFDSASSLLLDMTPNSNISTFSDRKDPALVAGLSFTDPASGVTITTASGTVNIAVGQPSCLRGDPVVTLSPPESQWVVPGTPVVYDATLTSTDSDACAAAVFDLSSSVPGGWTGSFDTDVLTVAPGASASAQLTVASAPTAADGFSDIVVTATNSAEPGYTGSATVTYVVSAASGNEAPTPADDQAATAIDTEVTLNVLANDTDPDGDPLFISQVSPGANGAVQINPDGTVTYQPAPLFKGTDVFQYTVSDGLQTAAATATVTVRKKRGGNGGGGRDDDGGGGGRGKDKNP
jgi:hypothetical protein